MPDLEDDTLQRLGDLYAGDALLSKRLADALAVDAIAEAGAKGASGMSSGTPGSAPADRGAGAQVEKTARATAEFLTRPDGPRVAVFETTGWDTLDQRFQRHHQRAASKRRRALVRRIARPHRRGRQPLP